MPEVLHHLRGAKCFLAVLRRKRSEKRAGFTRSQVEQIHSLASAHEAFMRHFRSFHQLYAITKFNPLPSLLRLAAV